LGFVVDKVALGEVFPRVLRFFPVNFISPVLHYTEKRKKLIIFITALHNKPSRLRCFCSICCGALHKRKSYGLKLKDSEKPNFIPLVPLFLYEGIYLYFALQVIVRICRTEI
jgi:hypothetical protein